VSIELRRHPKGDIYRRKQRISCRADDVHQVEGRPCVPDQGDVVTTLTQPRPLIVEARVVVVNGPRRSRTSRIMK
jgi:hypothetical protein